MYTRFIRTNTWKIAEATKFTHDKVIAVGRFEILKGKEMPHYSCIIRWEEKWLLVYCCSCEEFSQANSWMTFPHEDEVRHACTMTNEWELDYHHPEGSRDVNLGRD